ncbi:hypothetical protein E4U36_005446 [Claviceps purpurea]|nr:hypothetical protein E4U36_005446 [Claviceps purpurea]
MKPSLIAQVHGRGTESFRPVGTRESGARVPARPRPRLLKWGDWTPRSSHSVNSSVRLTSHSLGEAPGAGDNTMWKTDMIVFTLAGEDFAQITHFVGTHRE